MPVYKLNMPQMYLLNPFLNMFRDCLDTTTKAFKSITTYNFSVNEL